MKKVLVTGGSGFIGRNICPQLEKNYDLYYPSRFELNLLDEKEVRDYIYGHDIQIVINLANPNPVKNHLDKTESFFEDSIRLFMNLYNSRDLFDYMYYFGSGAEYDKSNDIILAKEEDSIKVPYDSYGLAKYTINKIISQDDKMCNFRIFGCYGPTDHESKFITHAIHCCMNNEDITIRQDCYFDYIHVYDLIGILCYFLDNKPQFNCYNICSGKRVLLSDIADIVRRLMNSNSNIHIFKDGLNNEYTGCNQRLLDFIGDYHFISLEEGIKMQIETEIRN